MFTNNPKPMHILIAIDGSEHAMAGVQVVRAMPLPAEALVTLMTVFLPRNASNITEYELNLQKARHLLEGKNIQVREELLAGIPAEVLSDFAVTNQVSLIVVGAVGLRATMGILLGGVAQQIVEYAQRPVLVVRAPFNPFQHALLVTDGSECSERALEYLHQFSLPENSALDVMHVLPPPPVPQSVVMAYAWPVSYTTNDQMLGMEEREVKRILKEEEDQGDALLARSLEKIRTFRPDLELKSILRRGDAATEVLEYTHNNPIDLIIAGSRGLSQVRGWLLGSVSRKLLHYANCSVLVVRSQPGCTPEFP